MNKVTRGECEVAAPAHTGVVRLPSTKHLVTVMCFPLLSGTVFALGKKCLDFLLRSSRATAQNIRIINTDKLFRH